MAETVIEVKGLYKRFCRNLKYSMLYGLGDAVKSTFNKDVESINLRKGEFWALQDINFSLKKGEILGVIGHNGSGKSTLLRVLTGIFPPDLGSVKIQGQVGALIAVGAGFHPHMTGAENIYLNGTILGMKKAEIDAKFNEIVDFAEIGDFIHAPVLTYSSGMKVRLGFSIAVHRVPEILLVDEVLSVGDINFKKKSLEKMEEIRKESSIIFISHNLNQVSRICNRAILIEKGRAEFIGNTEEAIVLLNKNTFKDTVSSNTLIFSKIEEIESFRIISVIGVQSVRLEFEIISKIEILNPIIGFTIENEEGLKIFSSKNIDYQNNPAPKIKKGFNRFTAEFNNLLMPNQYLVKLKWKFENNLEFISAQGGKFKIDYDEHLFSRQGIILVNPIWK